jgi:hypothetical protein
VQLRRYSPIDVDAGRLPYQIFNVYFPTGERKTARLISIIQALLSTDFDDLTHTFLAGDLNND